MPRHPRPRCGRPAVRTAPALLLESVPSREIVKRVRPDRLKSLYSRRCEGDAMSLRSELVRAGLRWLIKRRIDQDLTLERHRQFARAVERLVPDPPTTTRTLKVNAGGVLAD